jgi:6-phosphogluconolactonase
VPELVVTDDVAGEAVRRFLEVAPRVVALAGGETPKPFYERLSGAPYAWEQVDVLLTDERCVPRDHPQSNLRMVEEALLRKVRAPVHAFAGDRCDPDPHDREIRDLLERSPLDLAVLGLGDDGHTASLFPGDPALDERQRRVVRVEGPDHARLTLTLPVLSSARLAMFLVTGASKRDVLWRFLEGEDLPATRVRAEGVLVMADPSAAA